MAAEHVLNICRDFLTSGYTAECSCGWAGREWSDDSSDALDEWENHCDVVFMEATRDH